MSSYRNEAQSLREAELLAHRFLVQELETRILVLVDDRVFETISNKTNSPHNLKTP